MDFRTIRTTRRVAYRLSMSYRLRRTSSSGGGGGAGRAVVIRGQGEDQGFVKMGADGTLSFSSEPEDGEVFVRCRYWQNQNAVCTFESTNYPGCYIWANTQVEDFTVHGMRTDRLEKAYWRMLQYSTVTGDIDYYRRMDPAEPWYCLQYWGDERYRTTNLQNGLFLVAEQTATMARFLLRSLQELKDQENGIFSFI